MDTYYDLNALLLCKYINNDDDNNKFQQNKSMKL